MKSADGRPAVALQNYMRCGSDPLPAVDKGAVRNIQFLWKRNWFFLTAVCFLAELAVVEAIPPVLSSAPCIDAQETVHPCLDCILMDYSRLDYL